MAFMTNILISAELTNWIGKLLLLLYNWVGNFGWTVVVFSILLKLILSPLDIWQRVSMRNQQKKMAALRPKLEKLEKQYGKNPDLLKQKQYELQRSAKINVFSSCIPLIVTMVVFFVVFAGFRALVTYENEVLVEDLDQVYTEYMVDYNFNQLTEEQQKEILNTQEYSKTYDSLQAYCTRTDASGNLIISKGFIVYETLEADSPTAYAELNEKLANKYEENLEKVGWLWVKNVFKSDVGTDVIPSYKSYISTGTGGIGASISDTQIHTSYTNLVQSSMSRFNKTSTWDIKNWNGYFILPILSLLTSFLSTFIMQRSSKDQQSIVGTKEQQQQQQKTQKIMTYMMPIMLAVFSMLYSAAFAIYYFVSNVMSTLTTLLINTIMKAKEKKELAQEDSSSITIS